MSGAHVSDDYMSSPPFQGAVSSRLFIVWEEGRAEGISVVLFRCGSHTKTYQNNGFWTVMPLRVDRNIYMFCINFSFIIHEPWVVHRVEHSQMKTHNRTFFFFFAMIRVLDVNRKNGGMGGVIPWEGWHLVYNQQHGTKCWVAMEQVIYPSIPW